MIEKHIMKPPKKELVCPLGDSTLCAVLSVTPLLACTLLCLRGWLLHSSGSVAEVQSHLDHFTRGTKGAERSHWPCTRQAELYASLTSLVWHFSCICPLPTPPYVTTTAVQKRIIVCRDINQMNSIWGQSAVSALSLLSQLSCKVTIMTECQKRAKCSQLTQNDILNKTETSYLTPLPSSITNTLLLLLSTWCVCVSGSKPLHLQQTTPCYGSHNGHDIIKGSIVP